MLIEPVPFYGCEFATLKEEFVLRVFKNEVLRRLFRNERGSDIETEKIS
jgi:hypothetical protein